MAAHFLSEKFHFILMSIDKLFSMYFLSYQHVQHMTSQILLILIDFLAILWSEITLL